MIRICSVLDSQANHYSNPRAFQTDLVARRELADMVNADDGNLISKHAEDFTLCVVGEFDDETGVLTGFDAPLVLVKASNLIRTED